MKKGEFARHCTPFRPSTFHELKLREARIVRYCHGDARSRSIQIVLNFLPQQLRNESITKIFCKRMFTVRFERTIKPFTVNHINVTESTVTIYIVESELYANRFKDGEVVVVESRDRSLNLRVEPYTYEEPPAPAEPDEADKLPF